MRYRARHAESKLKLLADHFKVVLVTGARQVGKSTLLSHLFPGVKTVVFDPVQDIYGARTDPDLFLDSFPPPAILDEIHYAPELLAALKRRVDRVDAPGQYFLTGSQHLGVLRSVAESMAGRVGILHLEGMTVEEMLDRGGEPGWLGCYLDEPVSLLDRLQGVLPEAGPLTRFLWRGGLPGLLDAPDQVVPDFLRSYVQTYVERDVRQMGNIQELASFGRFLDLSGALTAQEINRSQLGRDVGVAPRTARNWLDLLLHTYQWRELPPYHGSTVKRVSGKRKGYIGDTGLACWLQRLSSPEALAASPLLGAIFETWGVNAVHHQFVTLTVPPIAYHWRTVGGAEVDIVLERDGRLYPIEVKCKTHLNGHDSRGLRAFRQTYGPDRVMPALIVYAGEACYRVNPHTIALPWNATVS